MTALSQLSRALYKASRAASDANTLDRQGPEALAEKLVRRRVRRTVLSQFGRWGR